MQGNVLRKHVTLIHAHSNMSLLQRKAFNFLLTVASKIKPEDYNQSGSIDCRTTLKELKDSINFNSKNTKYLKESIDSLASLSIEWNILMDKLPSDISFMNLRILHGSPIFSKDGSLEFSFHKYIFRLIGSPDIYGTIDMSCQSRFESRYSHALYENSTRILNMINSKVVDLNDLKRILGVRGNSYVSTREFNKKIVKPALEEVNDRSDFIVTLNPLTEGRRVKAFEVSVGAKKRTIYPVRKEPGLETSIVEIIKKTFGPVSRHTLGFIAANYSNEYILEKIEYTRKNTKQERGGVFPVRYFISALKDDYKNPEAAEDEVSTESEENKKIKEWLFELNRLESDVRHWKKVLSRSREESNKDAVVKILSGCKNKLEKHLVQDPR